MDLAVDQILEGEDIKRYKTNLKSKIKQVASNLALHQTTLLTQKLSVKIAQGAKPGEADSQALK